jgi:metal-responsive CopG/Arc/MetJ family transcriptional regulator
MMYILGMIRINIYIPETLNKQLEFTAQRKKQVKAEVIREALEKGLPAVTPKDDSAKRLLELAKMAEKIHTGKAPNDVSINHDYYAWGGEKRSEED